MSGGGSVPTEEARYPELVRNTYFEGHDFTLRLSDNVEARLSQQQVVSLWKQIEEDQRPFTEEERATLKAELAAIRADVKVTQQRRGVR